MWWILYDQYIYIYQYNFFLCPDVSLEMGFWITEITGCGKTTRQKRPKMRYLTDIFSDLIHVTHVTNMVLTNIEACEKA